jgi:hypothetical protein
MNSKNRLFSGTIGLAGKRQKNCRCLFLKKTFVALFLLKSKVRLQERDIAG